ncbi:hypothetical protein SPMU_20480 [Sphingomonas mucosissima]|uniref:Uncharacterized protein n=2 Tax=Sphingomonas mucosissima TaxID=370959 RepID=A0A245ZIQ7_9SPHN|nr:hypothetical protein SPMU_20480 [Sphingomonas mucosissima]
MRRKMSLHLVDAVRHALEVADGLGLSETSLHLNAALITLDGKGVPPPPTPPQGGTVH